MAHLERAIQAAVAHAKECGDEATEAELREILKAFYARRMRAGSGLDLDGGWCRIGKL